MTTIPTTTFLLALALAVPATAVWRLLGALLARRIDADGVALQWVRAVAVALVAALVANIIVHPAGFLAATTLAERLTAMMAGTVIWAVSRRVELAVLLAAVVFFGLQTLW